MKASKFPKIFFGLFLTCLIGSSLSGCLPCQPIFSPTTQTFTKTPTQFIATSTITPATSTSLPVSTKTHTSSPTITSITATTSFPTATPYPRIRFAVIGDYGEAGTPLKEVAELITTWNVDFIITTGDNNYEYGEASTIDMNIGQYFSAYIYPYFGSYGKGADKNRFFPSLGNHDWLSENAKPYLDYFTLPGNERYYEFIWGPAHFFALDSDPNEPDGVGVSSIQAEWLKERLGESQLPWKIVYFHHPAYSSSAYHGSTDWMQWPFVEWGASIVFSGHDHVYERLEIDGIPYLTVGNSGGDGRYLFSPPLQESLIRYRDDFGALLVVVNTQKLTLKFITRKGEKIDWFVVRK